MLGSNLGVGISPNIVASFTLLKVVNKRFILWLKDIKKPMNLSIDMIYYAIFLCCLIASLRCLLIRSLS